MFDNQIDNLNLVFFSHNPIYLQYNQNKNAKNGW